MDKISKAFSADKVNIGYIVAGYPNLEHTKEFLQNLDECVVDILEIGIPYSDPLADGKIIAQASFEALQNGVNTDSVFDMLRGVKTSKTLVLLVYYNVIFAYGIKRFIDKCKICNISALIIPDLPFEENEEMFKICKKNHIALIPLISVTSEHRAKKVLSRSSGFIYAIGAIGVTGSKQTPIDRLQNMVRDLKKMSKLPVCVGFGIRTNDDVKLTRKYADGVIVGTSIVRLAGIYSGENFIAAVNKLFR